MAMSSEGEIIKLSLEDEAKWKIEWTIEDIFSCTEKNVNLNSPCFTVTGSKWYLCMSMRASAEDVFEGASEFDSKYDPEDDSIGWIVYLTFLRRTNGQMNPRSVDYSFSLKKADGTAMEFFRPTDGYDFQYEGGCGCFKFLKRSELLEKKSEFAPSNALTLICFLQVRDNFDYTSRLVKLSENFEDLFCSKKFCDVQLRVQNEEFPAHKLVLATRSVVFAAMFDADMKEKNTGIVDIQDCDSGAFKDFLRFLYSGRSEIYPENVFNLYRIAHKYDVEELKSDCALFIRNSLSFENLYDAVILAYQFDEESVKIKTQDFFIKNFTVIVFTAKWHTFVKKNWRLTTELLKSVAADMISKSDTQE